LCEDCDDDDDGEDDRCGQQTGAWSSHSPDKPH
jgi:hypothetical protein